MLTNQTNYLSRWPMNSHCESIIMTDLFDKRSVEALLCVSKNINRQLSESAQFHLKNYVIAQNKTQKNHQKILNNLLQKNTIHCLTVKQTWEVFNVLQLNINNIEQLWEMLEIYESQLPDHFLVDFDRYIKDTDLLKINLSLPIMYDVLWKIRKSKIEEGENNNTPNSDFYTEVWKGKNGGWEGSDTFKEILRKASYLPSVKQLTIRNCTMSNASFELLKRSGKSIDARETSIFYRHIGPISCATFSVGVLSLALFVAVIGFINLASNSPVAGISLSGIGSLLIIAYCLIRRYDSNNTKKRIHMVENPSTQQDERMIPSGYLPVDQNEPKPIEGDMLV